MPKYAIYNIKNGSIKQTLTIPAQFINDVPIEQGFAFTDIDDDVNDVTHIILNGVAVYLSDQPS